MGIHLSFDLSGPTPWRAHGSASISLFFFDISVDFDISWGDDHKAVLPPLDARSPLLAALSDPRNWSAALPDGAEQAVSLGAGPAAGDAVVVHPLGRLAVHQRVVPLDVTISRFGSGVPDKWNHFELANVNLNGNPAPTSIVLDRFARGQFFELSDEDKLSKPSFEPMDAGRQIGLDNGAQGHRSTLQLHYETRIVDDPALPPRLLRLYRPTADTFGAHVLLGAAAQSPVLHTGEAKYLAPGSAAKVATGDALHVVASTETLVARLDVLAAGASRTASEQALAEHLAAHPEDAGALQVVPVYEAVGA
jgi:hypothetical protein